MSEDFWDSLFEVAQAIDTYVKQQDQSYREKQMRNSLNSLWWIVYFIILIFIIQRISNYRKTKKQALNVQNQMKNMKQMINKIQEHENKQLQQQTLLDTMKKYLHQMKRDLRFLKSQIQEIYYETKNDKQPVFQYTPQSRIYQKPQQSLNDSQKVKIQDNKINIQQGDMKRYQSNQTISQ